jgi:hypothetical protein
MSPVQASSPALTTFTLYLVAYAVLLALAASLYVIIVHTGNAAHAILIRLSHYSLIIIESKLIVVID